MKKLIFALTMSVLVFAPISAKKATKEYQRPSLHLVLLNTDEPTSDLVADLMPTVSASWNNYQIPVQYNDWEIGLKEMNAGAPKGGLIQLITQYSDPTKLNSMSLDQLNEVKEMLSGKQYRADLKERCDAQSNLVAHQIIAKWFNINESTGTCDMDTIFKYACYSATQAASNEAVATGSSAAFDMFEQLMEPTIANSYVGFSKVNFYANEPIELFNKNLALAIIALTVPNEIAQAAAILAAEKAYEKTKEGYRAYTNTLLYKLKWNDEVYKQLLSIMNMDNTGKGTIDVQKFKEMQFEMEYLGDDACHTTVRLNQETKGMSKEEMVTLCVHKNLNKQLVNMQNQYEEFKPMMPILEVNKKYILADMGTKEGVAVGDAFDILEPVTNEKGVTKYKWVGTVKVVKGGVWDNIDIDNTLTADDIENDGTVNGTKLSKFNLATTSMFVKKQKATK